MRTRRLHEKAEAEERARLEWIERAQSPHDWFAWHPVQADSGEGRVWVWLETVERHLIYTPAGDDQPESMYWHHAVKTGEQEKDQT